MQKNEIAIFGGGCFWCTEAVFKMLKGVISVTPGYAGGNDVPKNGNRPEKKDQPTYKEVSSGKTGHAEVIRIAYDPAKISFKDLLAVFFATHDPTTKNRQGNDVGTQYRSIILYTTETQKEEAEHYIEELNKSDEKGVTIVTEVKKLERFYEAEEYHRDYYRRNRSQPYCAVVINPKLKKVQEKFAALLAKENFE